MKHYVIALKSPKHPVCYYTGTSSSNNPKWSNLPHCAVPFEYPELAKRELDAVFLANPDYAKQLRDSYSIKDDTPLLYIMEMSTSPVFAYTDEEVTKRLEMITNTHPVDAKLEAIKDAVKEGCRSS